MIRINTLLSVLLLFISCNAKDNNQSTLKNVFDGKFYIGTALSVSQLKDSLHPSLEIVRREFNSVVAENCMKAEVLQPREGEFDFSDADRFVEFAEENGLFIVGHTLIWHSQAPKWFFTDDNGYDVSKEVLIKRMQNHIHTVVNRYKGRVKGWDVVNEALNDDGDRKSVV